MLVLDVLDRSVESPATRLDPVQVAGIYDRGLNSVMRTIVPGVYLEFTLGMDRHPTKFTRLSHFA